MDIKPKNWLLLRGLAREKRHWGIFPALLKEYFPDHNFYPLELPGVGQKVKMSAMSTIDGYADHLREEWLHLKRESDGPWGIIAISMGGMIAMNWCARYQSDMAALVLMNTSGGNLSAPHHRFSPSALKMVIKLFFKENYQERERAILELTTRKADISTELIHEYATYSAEHPIKRKNFLKQIYAAAKFKVPLKINTPLLILAGKHDGLAHYKCSRTLADHFKAKTVLNEEAGHDLPLEDPIWIAEQIDSFLKAAYS